MAQDPYPGLTIITLRTNTDSCFIDMDQNVVKTWHGDELPTEFAYMLPDSSVLRPSRVPNADGRSGRTRGRYRDRPGFFSKFFGGAAVHWAPRYWESVIR